MCLVSIIIPAFNEEEFIGEALSAIRSNPPPCPYEVIVVDNGSTDRTPDIVGNHAVTLVDHPTGTVASVRNRGAHASMGQVLVFIDADVVVSKQWSHELASVIEQLSADPLLVTGSRCLPSDNDSWLNKYWFAYLNDYEASYINSGHLITSRTLFDQIGGFSADLETAEDYDFCRKASDAGAHIFSSKNLPVTHLGYPKTLKNFIARERWHGSQDVKSLSAFCSSKVAWAAFANIMLVLVSVALLLHSFDWRIIVAYVIAAYVLGALLSLKKFRLRSIKSILITPFFFYFYIIGRSLSIVDRLWLVMSHKKGSGIS